VRYFERFWGFSKTFSGQKRLLIINVRLLPKFWCLFKKLRAYYKVMWGLFKESEAFLNYSQRNWGFFHYCGTVWKILRLFKYIFKEMEAFVYKCEAFVYKCEAFLKFNFLYLDCSSGHLFKPSKFVLIEYENITDYKLIVSYEAFKRHF
jgi:hypothetical protein